MTANHVLENGRPLLERSSDIFFARAAATRADDWRADHDFVFPVAQAHDEEWENGRLSNLRKNERPRGKMNFLPEKLCGRICYVTDNTIPLDRDNFILTQSTQEIE